MDQTKKDAIKAEILAELREEKMREDLKKELRAEMWIGQQNSAYSVTGEQKDRIVASLLAFFLGAFGAHQFYLGNTTKGIIYLLLFFISWIFAIIDIIRYLQCKNNEEFTQKFANK